MIEFRGISKQFPGVRALDDVSFTVQRGACHALLGENGAGKSTLGKLLAGIYQPDAGEMEIAGRKVAFHSPRDAMQGGVAIVHQELVFCPNLSIAENLCLHDLPSRGWRLDRAAMHARAKNLLNEIGLRIDPATPVAKLSIAQEQLVQIAAAVGLGAQVVVFDEPTSSLGRDEVSQLFALVRRLQQAGVTVIYVSHRLEEIFELCQAVTVLRDGRHVATVPIAGVTREQLVTWMVGRDVEADQHAPATAGTAATARDGSPPRLQVIDFSSPEKFSEVNLQVAAGEIVGLAGLVGAGRTELMEAIFGLDPLARGTVLIDGAPVTVRSPQQAMAHGMGLVPEDRKQHGLVLEMNVRQNYSMPILKRFRGWLGRIDRGKEAAAATVDCQRLAVRTPNLEVAVRALSGGNQQKIVLAKGVVTGTRVLLVDEPSRGVDIGAKQEIHRLLRAQAESGTAVLVVSSDLPELLALADRLVVLRGGRVVRELTRAAATPESVMRAMAGVAE